MICMSILFVILGVVFCFGKGGFLIAGFNTLPKEDKEKFNVASMCKFMGKMMFALAFSVSLWTLSEYLKKPFLFTIGIVLFISVIVFMLIYMNTGNRFKK